MVDYVHWKKGGNRMDLTILLTIIGCFAGTIGITIGLFLHLGNKIDNLQSAIYTEMKDFHGRLCTLEERRK